MPFAFCVWFTLQYINEWCRNYLAIIHTQWWAAPLTSLWYAVIWCHDALRVKNHKNKIIALKTLFFNNNERKLLGNNWKTNLFTFLLFPVHLSSYYLSVIHNNTLVRDWISLKHNGMHCKVVIEWKSNRFLWKVFKFLFAYR